MKMEFDLYKEAARFNNTNITREKLLEAFLIWYNTYKEHGMAYLIKPARSMPDMQESMIIRRTDIVAKFIIVEDTILEVEFLEDYFKIFSTLRLNGRWLHSRDGSIIKLLSIVLV